MAAGRARVATLVVLAVGIGAAAVLVSDVVAWPGPATTSDADPDDEVALPDDVRFDDPSTDDAPLGQPDAAPPEPDDPDQPADPDGSGEPTSRDLSCEPAGCELWRIEDGSLGRLVVGDDALAYVNVDELTIVDVDTAGIILHRGRVELADGAPPDTPPSAMHLDDDLLVVVFGDQVVGLDPADGRHLWSAQLDHGSTQSVTEHDGDLILIGVAGSNATSDTDDTDGSTLAGSRPRTTIAVLTADGEIRWQDEIDMILTWPWVESPLGGRADDDPLLVADDDELVRRSLTDGRTRWRRSVEPDQQLLGWQLPMLSRRAADEIEVIDTATGERRSSIARADHAWAHALGPWVQVGTDDAIHVHDPDTGRELFRRGREDGLMPGNPGRAVEVGDGDHALVAVGWTPSGADAPPSIEVFHPDGSHQHTIEIPTVDAGDDGLRGVRQLEPLDDGAVRVVAGNLQVAEVDVGTGEVLNTTDVRVDDATHAHINDGVVVTGGQDGLVLEGPDGAVRIEGRAPALEHRDPLLVRDGTRLLRIDERLLGRW